MKQMTFAALALKSKKKLTRRERSLKERAAVVPFGEDIAIRGLAERIAQTVGFEGRLVFDRSKPDGMPRKPLDVTRLAATGWHPRVSLREGLAKAYEDYLARYGSEPQRGMHV
ncbi:MAG TPA: hypothetical protein VNO14_19895 [Blastocatellia bacterium]|nr:hypothetical protein [Blastocatellia bacterium]